MFSLFKKAPSSIPYKDKVWKTAEAATKGMLMMGMMKLQKNQPCLIMTFFESERDSLISFMTEYKLNYVALDGSNFEILLENKIYWVDRSAVSNSTVAGFLEKNAVAFMAEVYFPGHYPLSVPENKVLEKLLTLGFNSFLFCISFDDPLLKMFGSERILPLLETLGLEEQEALEHDMITQSIKRARAKIDKKVVKEIQAKSPEEWFKFNGHFNLT